MFYFHFNMKYDAIRSYSVDLKLYFYPVKNKFIILLFIYTLYWYTLHIYTIFLYGHDCIIPTIDR